MQKEIAILDFGSQYTHLIARRVRELGVVSHIYPNDVPAEALNSAYGIILSGGPKSTLSDDRLSYDPKIFELNIPILGLCYGHQLIAQHFGGSVSKGLAREYGLAKLAFNNQQLPIFNDIPDKTTVWMSHGDHVEKLPDGFVQIATTGNESVAAMGNEERKIYGFQFHPEVTHTEHGKTMLQNFIFGICKAGKNWSTDEMLTLIQKEIREQAGNKKVFLLLSGGVDSTVCFALLEKTLGKDRVYGFHIDHGFMRKNETAEVTKALAGIGADNLHIYDASEEYFKALEGVTEPEEKRKIIGNLFLDITERVMKELNFNDTDWLLGQGTIYPDTIESGGTKNADKIKTHHNRVDRVHDMIAKGLIIEPIKELYKDEVREIGRLLRLPDTLISRRPFPGPGIAIWCLCSTPNQEQVSKIYLPEITVEKLYKLPVKSVGVQGDERSYAHPILISDYIHDWNYLHTISPKITNNIKDVNRVIMRLWGKEEMIESSILNRATLTRDRVDKVRELDALISPLVLNDKRCRHVWEMPIVLIPFGYNTGESVVIRPLESEEVMTARFAELPKDILKQIIDVVEKSGLVDFLFFDITNKPPGTVQWE